MTQKERIVVQTAQMFAEQGIKSVRMDDIARELSVSKRTLYELFGDKETLIHLSLSHHFDSLREEHKELCKGAENTIDAIYIVLSNIIKNGHITSRLMNNLNKFYPRLHQQIIEEHSQSNRSSLKTMILRGIEEGIFSEKFNIELAINILYNSANSAHSSLISLIPEGMRGEDVIVQIVTTFFRGLSTPKGLEIIDMCLDKHSSSLKR